MYFNGASCDIYIGQGAGKKLMEELREAQKSIKIVSPYLSPSMVKELIDSKARNPNLEIQLITTNEIEDFYGSYEKNIYKLIVQNRHLDSQAEVQRNRWKRISKVLLIVTIGLALLEYSAILFAKDWRLIFGFIPIIILSIALLIYKSKINNKRIYKYSYSQAFPFRVYLSRKETGNPDDALVHSKIYLIDDRVAYLGSLNFTRSGTTLNYETRIRTTDRNAITKMNDEYFELFHNSDFPEKDIQDWGRSLYKEPIN